MSFEITGFRNWIWIMIESGAHETDRSTMSVPSSHDILFAHEADKPTKECNRFNDELIL